MRRQLRLMVLAITSMTVIAFVVPLALLVRTLAVDRAVSRATSDAQYVGQLIAASGRQGAASIVAEAARSIAGSTTVYYSDGTTVGDPSHAPAPESLALARRGRAFSRSVGNGVDVFVPVLEANARTAVVRVSLSGNDLVHGVWTAWWALALLGLVLVAVAVLVADRMARSITAPMRRLTDLARRLGAGDLDARARLRGPSEVIEVSDALNGLAGRIGELLQAERDHAADLSHRLRTPLTALRLDADLLRDDDESRMIASDAEALERAVSSVIADTRADRRAPEPRNVDLATAVRDRIAFWKVLAHGQRRIVELSVNGGPLRVGARRCDVEELVDVLLGNVMRHTPAGRAARVTVAARPGGGAFLTVEDAGGGFAAPAQGSSGAPSTGLGLDIARRIAAQSGGSVALGASDLGGARVDVELGPPAQDAG